MKPDRRAVLIPVGGVGRMFIEMFQLGSLVSPALCTGGLAKPTTAESKVKSPWKPTKLAPPVVVLSMSVVVTGVMRTVEAATEASIVSTGRATVIPGKGVIPSGTVGSGGKNPPCRAGAEPENGVGVGVDCADAALLIRTEAVTPQAIARTSAVLSNREFISVLIIRHGANQA